MREEPTGWPETDGALATSLTGHGLTVDVVTRVIIASRPALMLAATPAAEHLIPVGATKVGGSELRGEGIGGERLGHFSTGIARERVTARTPGRTLAFAVLSQPPSMHEMSPYREVHAPHVSGYFDTRDTRFDLRPLPGGGTRLTVSTTHVLRMDPVLYWEPLARLAIRMNVARVLSDIDVRSRRSGNYGVPNDVAGLNILRHRPAPEGHATP